jgi:hypothetical protein
MRLLSCSIRFVVFLKRSGVIHVQRFESWDGVIIIIIIIINSKVIITVYFVS